MKYLELAWLSFSLTWDNPFVYLILFEWVGILVGVFYWVYTSRLKIGYKARFVVPSAGEDLSGDVVFNSDGKPIDVVHGIYYYVFGRPVEYAKNVWSDVLNVVREEPFRKTRIQYKEIGEKEFRATDKFVSFRGKSFSVDLTKLAHRKFGWEYLYFNFNTETILTFGGEYIVGGDAQIVDDVMSGGLFSGLFKLSSKLSRMQLLMLVLAFATGACLVGMIVVAVYQGVVIPDIYERFGFVGGVLFG